MDSETKQAIDGLRELIMTKFEALEKQLELREITVNERRAAQACRDEDQDKRLTSLEVRVSVLEKAPAEQTKGTWQRIKDKVLDWLVPFLLAGFIFWMSTGFKIK